MRLAGRRVEIAGRLVGEQHVRLGDERARNGDALLLAAGQLPRVVTDAAGEADAAEHSRGGRARVAAAAAARAAA